MSRRLSVQRKHLRRKKRTSRKSEFNKMRNWFPTRLNIVSEGDSWFAYPPNWIIKGKPSNLVDHISIWTKGKANFYSMASIGDEAVDMISGKQKHDLVNILRWHTKSGRKPIDILLFSGGGNDVVGENDFERYLKPYTPGATAEKCVDLDRLRRKARQIGLAYEELADIRDHYSPSTIIFTHTYDYPYPSDEGGVFLGGLIKTKGWMKRFMDADAINIPEELQAEVIKIFMDALAEQTEIVANRSGFHVVDTRGTLTGQKEWLNEIHPDSSGFEKIAQVIYNEVKEVFPVLK